MLDPLQTDIKFLKGVGPARARILNQELQVTTVRDMLYCFPYKYVDRSVIHRIRDLQDGMPYVQLKGQIMHFSMEGEGRRRRMVAAFSDGTGFVELVWFNRAEWVTKTYSCGVTYLVLAKPTLFNGRISLAHPEMEVAAEASSQPLDMMPFYHVSERMKKQGFTSRLMAELVHRAFEQLGQATVPETLPPYLLQRHRLLPLDEALHRIHHPATAAALPEAVRRLKFEELFFLQLDILRYSRHRQLHTAGFVFSRVGIHFMKFYHECLPFELTEAQKRVVREIRHDLGTGRQMNRLLQGDVGSGKTMVALLCCLLAADNGFQSCIMAPTEILAEQHYASLQQYLDKLDVRVALLTGSVKGKQRREVLTGVADGSIQLLVGTHALIEPTVGFLNLGLVIIDEQHRFGVKQRAKLWTKNVRPPHILVMTATPIPRTLAMTVYGDLDVSVIDQLPPGRKPIRTVHYTQTHVAQLYDGMRHQLRLGRQIYVVFPLIKESETQDLRDLETGFNDLTGIFADFEVGMVHGKMKPADKDAAMRRFKEGHTHILVSTTVIEVGVNVPNASVMVVENAERFGLAQLHQLRGRVGRGAEQSYCILVTKDRLAETSRRRMQIMVESCDGFEIAEEDMKLRGPGDLEGTAQSGMPFYLKIAHVVKDRDLMQEARDAADALLQADPTEQLPQHAVVWRQLALLKKRQINFSAIS